MPNPLSPEQKASRAAYAREYRKTHPEKKRDRSEWSAQYRESQSYGEAQRKYRSSESGKECISQYGKKARSETKEKVAARWAVKDELRAGRLVRPGACEDCGKGCRPHGHHEDYAKPLQVNWLCPKCHAKRHK